MAPGSSATRKLARTGFWVRRTIKAPLRPETAKVIVHDILAKNGGRRGVVTPASKSGALPELSEIGRMRRFGRSRGSFPRIVRNTALAISLMHSQPIRRGNSGRSPPAQPRAVGTRYELRASDVLASHWQELSVMRTRDFADARLEVWSNCPLDQTVDRSPLDK